MRNDLNGTTPGNLRIDEINETKMKTTEINAKIAKAAAGLASALLHRNASIRAAYKDAHRTVRYHLKRAKRTPEELAIAANRAEAWMNS